jgi:DNA-binding MarR family transcriptional regulator
MDQIAEATGFSKRAVTDAIGILEQRNFITRLAGSGGQPNQYAITLAASPEAAATSNCVSPPEPTLTESAAAAANAIGMQETKQCTSTSAPKPQEVPSAAQPRQWTVSELVALRYRKVNEEELKEIRAAYPDEGDLWRRLARFDGVDRAMDLDFFIGAVRQFT